MNNQRTKRFLDLHALAGVLSGLFLFIVSLSGVFALFGDELVTWEDERLRIELPEKPAPLMPLLEAYVAKLEATGDVTSTSVSLPRPDAPFYEVTAWFRPEGQAKAIRRLERWHPETGELLPEPRQGMVHWLIHFHRSLMLPRTYGRALVGLSGIFMLLSILTGVIIHRKILKEIFTWRFHKSIRVKWQDSHKVLSVWGLPFHIMIAFTGAWLGMVALLLPATAVIALKGDVSAVFEALAGETTEPTGKRVEMVSLDTLLPQMEQYAQRTIRTVDVERWGDETAEYHFHYRPFGTLTGLAVIEARAETGEITLHEQATKPGITFHMVSAVTTLHFADFGGVLVKIVYALLGIALCLITVTGMMIWLEKRRFGFQGERSDTFYRRLGNLTLGVCLGMVVASFSLFYANYFLPASQPDQVFEIGLVYCVVWGSVMIYAMFREDEYRLARDLFMVSALSAAGIPVFNLLVTGSSRYFEGSYALYVAGADFICLLTGAVFFWTFLRLPYKRLDRKSGR